MEITGSECGLIFLGQPQEIARCGSLSDRRLRLVDTAWRIPLLLHRAMSEDRLCRVEL